MIELLKTSSLSILIDELLSDSHRFSNDDIDILKSVQTKNTINIHELKTLYKYCDDQTKKEGLRNLLKGSKLIFEQNEKQVKTEPSPELIERRKYLIMQQEKREYNKMIYGQITDPTEEQTKKLSTEFSSIKNQASIGMNMIITVFAAFGLVSLLLCLFMYCKN